ncbi:MAG: ATP-dependent Clp protease ATP-binding subunit, partial [Opitutales bacterium]|nr:ATP-dependent Clp protease ATP-binding subunit [Opitutales bacterium]
MQPFTQRAQMVLVNARKAALHFKHNYVGTEHLLLGILALGQGIAVNVLKRSGLNSEEAISEIESRLQKGEDKVDVNNIPYTPRAKKVLVFASNEATRMGHNYIGTEHLLLAILRIGEGLAVDYLKEKNIDLQKTRKMILEELSFDFVGDNPENAEEQQQAQEQNEEDGDENQMGKSSPKSALEAFGRDLTELAKRGELDPVVGRSNEILRVIQILCRRRKNNPVLIGEAGVGKTAIVEGLAQEIANGTVPEILLNKRVVSLDMTLMVAGAKYRGQFEERIKALMAEVEKDK